MLKYLIEKEFKQFKRNKFLPRLVLFMPCVMLLVLPWAANQEVTNINLSVVDNDKSILSQQIIQKVESSKYFNFVDYSSGYEQAMEVIRSGSADIIMEIPHNFEQSLVKEQVGKILISANTVNGTKGSIGSSYLSAIINSSIEMVSDKSRVVDIRELNKFNPRMDYKVFMVPAIMVMLLTLICGFLPALNIVGEKETGTIEQINVTPISKFVFVIAKLIPYWIIGYIILTLCFCIAYLVYGLVPIGSLLTIYLSATVYVLAISGFGLVISNYSGTMQQAMFVIFFFMLIFILLSGLFTPVGSMPEWAQLITTINPLKYFIQIMRQVYLKGSSMLEILPQVGALMIFAIVSNVWAVISYSKRN
ncbi:ABC-2 type transport system permease protein [Dysgonomonadaceae bacterium PH5-43]|nr:ABC-2 type transport system permease protein [Dysgonomonadaceae bacterium PH5-43]